MSDNNKLYINVFLSEKEAGKFLKGKEHSGISSNSDFMRHLIALYVRDLEG